MRSQQTKNRGESELTREECVREKNGQTWVEWGSGKRTDSPATPLPKALTASTTSSHYSSASQQNIQEVDKGRWKINKVTKLGFFPLNQGLTSPTPYPLEPCPFHSTLHCRSWLWFILIDVRVYMMATIMFRIARYTIGNYPHCRNLHNQIDGGDFGLSSSPRLITIYTSCKRGRN